MSRPARMQFELLTELSRDFFPVISEFWEADPKTAARASVVAAVTIVREIEKAEGIFSEESQVRTEFSSPGALFEDFYNK